MRAVIAIIIRDIMAAFRRKITFLTALVRPLIWLLILGAGIKAAFATVGPYDYQQFMVPGLIAMVLLFNGTLSAIAITLDRSTGVNKLLMTAPLSRSTIIIARIISASIIALVHATILILLLVPFGFIQSASFIPGLIPVMIVCAAMGVTIAMFSDDFQDFSIIINYLILPMFFLSGALYPITSLPKYLDILVQINPFSYCVDLLQHGFQLDAIVRFSVVHDLTVILCIVVILTAFSCWRYSKTY